MDSRYRTTHNIRPVTMHRGRARLFSRCHTATAGIRQILMLPDRWTPASRSDRNAVPAELRSAPHEAALRHFHFSEVNLRRARPCAPRIIICRYRGPAEPLTN